VEVRESELFAIEAIVAAAYGGSGDEDFPQELLDAAKRDIVWRFCPPTAGDAAAAALLHQQATPGDDAAVAEGVQYACANSRARRFDALMAAPQCGELPPPPLLLCDAGACAEAGVPGLLAALRQLKFLDDDEFDYGQVEEDDEEESEADHWDDAFTCACLACDDDFARRAGVCCRLPSCRERGTAGPLKLRSCAACGVAAYCSQEHQKENWKQHKKACKHSSKLNTVQREARAALPLRCASPLRVRMHGRGGLEAHSRLRVCAWFV
jgi:hypothetical protein